MAVNKLAISHERQKMKLRGEVLSHRVRIAELQQNLKAKRQELASMKQKKPGQI